MTIKHLTQCEPARRWAISPRTLERWRWMGEGPRFLKIGGRCAYRLQDILEFEEARLRQCTSPSASGRQ